MQASATPADVSSTTHQSPDFAAIKARQQVAWGSGNYARVGVTLQIVGETLCEALDLRAGANFLDVAGGNGNAALAAARRFARVTCSDYVQSLLDHARQRATVEGLELHCVLADVEELPFADNEFDVVASTFGAMFAPDHQTTARQMLRVVKPGGQIGMANWTPDSFIGGLFRTLGKYVPPPAGVDSPALWGTEDHLEQLFAAASKVHTSSQSYVIRYHSAQHWLQVWREIYGPLQKAFASLEADAADALTADLLTLVAQHNRSNDDTMVVPSTYLQVLITK